jgi:DNA invertase Pin-like site-specific DNA recombinase
VKTKKSAEPPVVEGLLIGYARVSTKEQDLGAQTLDLKKAGCARVYSDKKSGVSRKRPGLALLWKDVRAGDTVVVTSIDRFGRSTLDLLTNLKRLDAEGVHFKSLKESVDTKTALGRFVFTLLASLAELERNWISERTARTMRHNKEEKGAKYGRDHLVDEAGRAAIRSAFEAGVKVSTLAKQYRVSRASIRNYIKKT